MIIIFPGIADQRGDQKSRLAFGEAPAGLRRLRWLGRAGPDFYLQQDAAGQIAELLLSIGQAGEVRPVLLVILLSRADISSGRMLTRRTVLRDGHVRRMRFFTRMFTFTELRDWLLDAGFASVDVFDEQGAPLSLESRRMLVRAGAGAAAV